MYHHAALQQDTPVLPVIAVLSGYKYTHTPRQNEVHNDIASGKLCSKFHIYKVLSLYNAFTICLLIKVGTPRFKFMVFKK